MIVRNSIIPLPPGLFDPRSIIEVLILPEGTRALNPVERLVFLKGEGAYDPLWPYVKATDTSLYKGQGAAVRVGEYFLGLRGPNRIPSFVDFKKEVIFVGRKLTIPFNSLRGIMIGHGLLPWRKVPVFVVFLKVDGCDKYLPIHQCHMDMTIIDLADFLSSHLRVPLGLASTPLHFLIHPGASRMIHSKGETPIYEIRGLLTARHPDGNTRISLMAGPRRISIVDEPDPLGWKEKWGIIADDLLSIVARRTRPRYGVDP